MSQTLMLVFFKEGHEVHIPVQQAEITPYGVVTENGMIARIVVSPGKWGYQLFKDMGTGEGSWDGETYNSVKVYRLMPSGDELSEALSKFDADMQAKQYGEICEGCDGVGDHRCSFVNTDGLVCGISRMNHVGMMHSFNRCLNAPKGA